MRLTFNTEAEEAAIQAGIEADPDAPELTDAAFAGLRPAADVLPGDAYAALFKRRGPQKAPLDQDPIQHLREPLIAETGRDST